MDKKCITFVWRQDLQRKTVNNGTVSFKTVNEEDYKYKDFTLFFDNERDMLISFIKYVQKTDCDMFSGWNVKDFDMAYIINRMNSIGMDYRRLSPMNVALTNKYGDVLVKGRIIFDMLEAYRKMQYGELDSYRLDNVASHELGEKKIKYAGSLHSLWQDDLDKFIAYNKKDTMLVYRIEKKKKIVQTFDETRRLSKCSFNDVFNNSRVVDSFMLHFTKGKFVHPTKKHHRKQSFAGAFVLKPKKGIHKNSVVFDYTSLYPKIISSLNASPETLQDKRNENSVHLKIPYLDHSTFMISSKDGEKFDNRWYDKISSAFDEFFKANWDLHKQDFKIELPATISKHVRNKNVYFSQDKKGFLPGMLEYLFDERINIQAERDKYDYNSPEYIRLEFKQFAFKILMNSFYGTLGYYGFRLYMPDIAAATTFVGRNSVLWNRYIASKNNYDTLYGDTDSNFLKAKYQENELIPVLEEGNKIAEFLQDSYDDFANLFNCKQHYFKINFEKAYKRIFFGQAKKRYAGLLSYYKGKEISKMQIVGFEVVRSDQSIIARKTQKCVFKMLIEEEQSKENIVKYVRNVEKDIRNDKYSFEEIGLPTPLKKPLNEYQTNIPTVRGVIFSNKNLKLNIQVGEKFLLIYVRGVPGMQKTDVIAFRNNDDIPEKSILDYDKHVKEATTSKMERIFEGLGWSILDLKGQQSLFDY